MCNHTISVHFSHSLSLPPTLWGLRHSPLFLVSLWLLTLHAFPAPCPHFRRLASPLIIYPFHSFLLLASFSPPRAGTAPSLPSSDSTPQAPAPYPHQPSSSYHHPPSSTYPGSQPSPAGYGGPPPGQSTAHGAPTPAAGYGAPQAGPAGYGGVHQSPAPAGMYGAAQPQAAAFGGGVQPFPAFPRAPPPAPSTLNFGGVGGGTVAPRAPEPAMNGVYYGGGAGVAAAGGGAHLAGSGGYSQGEGQKGPRCRKG